MKRGRQFHVTSKEIGSTQQQSGTKPTMTPSSTKRHAASSGAESTATSLLVAKVDELTNSPSDGDVIGVVAAAENDPQRRTSLSRNLWERSASTRRFVDASHHASSTGVASRRSQSSSSVQKSQHALPHSPASPKHFLQGVHIHNHCLDVMDIPDPPTPHDTRKIDSTARRRRRLSSPGPLCDIHANSHSPLLHTTTQAAQQQYKKKRRTSLSHVASPLEGYPSNMSKNEAVSSTSISSSGALPSASNNTNPVLVSSTLLTASQKPPLSRRRSSLCHATVSNTVVLESVPSQSLPQRESPPTKPACPPVVATAVPTAEWQSSPQPDSPSARPVVLISRQRGPPDHAELVHVLARVRLLVHSYTSNRALATTKGRAETQAMLIFQIHRGTNYTVTPPVTEWPSDADGGGDVPATATAENRQAVNRRKLQLWMAMGPDLKLMDEYKHAAAATVQTTTGARFDKHHRGSYRYYDTESHQRIPPELYEHRYRQMLAATHNPWAAHFERLRRWPPPLDGPTKSDVPHDVVQIDTAAPESMPVPNNNDSRPSGHETRESAATTDKLVSNDADDAMNTSLNESVIVTTSTIATTPSDEMKLTFEEDSNSPELEFPLDTLNESQPISRSIVEGEAADHNVSGMIAVMEYAVASHGKAVGRVDDACEPSVRLPLPSRDETSLNPAIAQAETRLWNAIDAALETYSREILFLRMNNHCETVAATQFQNNNRL